MTGRPGKAPQTASSAHGIKHLRGHLHLTNCIHLKNHVHMQKHAVMMEARRPPQLPLMRELTALRNARYLRDPSTTSSLSTFSVGSSGGRVDARDSALAHRDEHKGVRVLSNGELQRDLRRTKLREGQSTRHDGRKDNYRGGYLRSGACVERDGAIEDIQSTGERRKDGNGNGNSQKKGQLEGNRRRYEKSATSTWESQLEIGAGSRLGDSRGQGLRAENGHECLAQRGHLTTGNLSKVREHSWEGRGETYRESRDNGRGGESLKSEDRWRGDAARRGDIARGHVCEKNGCMHSPLSHHSLAPNLTQDQALSLLGLGDHRSDAEESFYESEDGELHLVAREIDGGASSSHLESNFESPLISRVSMKPKIQRKPRISNRRLEAIRFKEGMRMGLHSHGHLCSQRLGQPGCYREAPVLTMNDELELSELPQQGCGIPWHWSWIHKYKARSFLDLAGRGLNCAFTESMKRKGDSKRTSRNGSFSGSHQDLEAAVMSDQSLSSLDSDANVQPRLSGENDSHASDSPPAFSFDSEAPARELPTDFGLMLARVRGREGGRKGTTQNRFEPSTDGAIQLHGSVGEDVDKHRSLSQKYRPKAFKDLVGQSLVVKSLSTAVTKGKIAPVYLFMGPRGTGKTTAARIFAAALNCLSSAPDCRPCGLCQECATLTLNRSPDVKEIDAASNPELESMRAILSNMGFSPSRSRYRVFIIEGCDFLSTEVWNTFLKCLEEPPSNVVFVLITTDSERVPLTAASRCQKFPFCKVKETDIVSRLQMLAAKENVEVDEGALSLIASRADGSLRDAETTLDQLSLLDKKVSLAIVQELVGLIPDNKLLDLLDLALSADTVNTVRHMREILDSGVEPLSLVSQLASLITNLLAGSFDIQRETRKKGFFKRNLSKKGEQQRLRQSLKVLSEAEKQLRVSNDRSTWLTAALLQFAPDRSYLPSSVDTSMLPSPIAFDTFERVVSGDVATPRLPTLEEPVEAQHKNQNPEKEILPAFPRLQSSSPALSHTLSAYLQSRRKGLPSAIQSDAKVHPAESPLDSHIRHVNRRLEKVARGVLWETAQDDSRVISDVSRAAGTREALANVEESQYSPRTLRMMARVDHTTLGPSLTTQAQARALRTGGDDTQNLEEVWTKVLQGCRSNVLRQLLQAQGKLLALSVAEDDTYAVAHVELRHPDHKARAERLRRSICHSFQMVLGCPVELKISLACQPGAAVEESNLSQTQGFIRDLPGSSSSSQKNHKLKEAIVKGFVPEAMTAVDCPLPHDQRQSKSFSNQQPSDINYGHSLDTGNATEARSVNHSQQSAPERESSGLKVEGERGQTGASWLQAAQQYAGQEPHSSDNHVDPLDAPELVTAHKSGRKMLKQRLDKLDENHGWGNKSFKRKNVKFKDGVLNGQQENLESQSDGQLKEGETFSIDLFPVPNPTPTDDGRASNSLSCSNLNQNLSTEMSTFGAQTLQLPMGGPAGR